MPNQKLSERFEEKFVPEPNTGCWLWTAYQDVRGYGRINVDRSPEKASRISYKLYVGPIPDGLCVCHKCDTPACVNPDHLFLGTQADNMRDKSSKGRQLKGERLSILMRQHAPRGEDASNAVLTQADVDYIRATYKGRGKGPSQKQLAVRFGVSRQHIGSVTGNHCWKGPPSTSR